MALRHRDNKNLVLLNGSVFNGVAVNHNYQLIENHLCSIQRVIGYSLEDHRRTFVVRVDLHLPARPDCVDYPMEFDTNVISRFMASLKAQVEADLLRKMQQGIRVHPCTVRYVWVKERNDALQDHYHVALFFNRDRYFNLGDYNQLGNNLSTKITKAWASALRREAFQAAPLVHFPKDTPYYTLDRNAVTFHQDYQSVFNRLSYLAKVDTKHYGDRTHSFGCSRK